METGINPNTYIPLYLQVADIMRRRIKTGHYLPSELLPSEKKLMDEYHISRNTAQKAIEELVRDGLVTRIQGRGTFVRKSIVDYGLQRLTGFSEEMESRGIKPGTKLLQFKRESASEDIASELSIQTGDEVFHLERVRLGNSTPMAYQHSYLPVNLTEGLDQFNFKEDSLFRVLENELNLRVYWQQQFISPVIASPEICKLLKVDAGTPLLYLRGVAYLDDDTPIEYKKIYYRSDMYNFSVRSTRNDILRIQLAHKV